MPMGPKLQFENVFWSGTRGLFFLTTAVFVVEYAEVSIWVAASISS